MLLPPGGRWEEPATPSCASVGPVRSLLLFQVNPSEFLCVPSQALQQTVSSHPGMCVRQAPFCPNPEKCWVSQVWKWSRSSAALTRLWLFLPAMKIAAAGTDGLSLQKSQLYCPLREAFPHISREGFNLMRKTWGIANYPLQPSISSII